MDLSVYIDPLTAWLGANGFKLAVTLLVLVLYMAANRLTKPKFEDSAVRDHFKETVAAEASRVVRLVSGFLGLLALAIVWGVDFRTVMIFATTTITLLGVALFASWSLLSNVTAHFVLLLHPSFKRGTFIRIVELDNYVEGYISELTLFNTKLVTESRETVLYPNNLLLQRTAIINPRDRLDVIGKLGAPPPAEPTDGSV